MSKNEFDELLLKKLQEEELEYNPAHWDRLAQLLPPTLTPTLVPKGRKWALATGIAAAIAFALATVFFIQLMNKSSVEQPQPPAIAHQGAAATKNVLPPQRDNTPAAGMQPSGLLGQNAPSLTGLPPTGNNTIAAQQHTGVAQQHTANNVTGNNIDPVPDHTVIPGSTLPPVPDPQENLINHPAPVIAQEPQPYKEEKKTGHTPIIKQKEEHVYTFNAGTADAAPSPYYEGNGSNKGDKKTSVSLAGGVNYGNLNTGYTAGISVRRKVAGGLFIDGTVAMMYNNNANNVAINNGPPLSDNGRTAARPTAFDNATSLASPALDPIQKLYYVQFNPSIGYQIEKHVSLSMGGDFQQILNSKGGQDEIVQPGTNSSKVFPNFDVGLTAKSEFSITPNIQAGLIYREGLSNLLRNDGAKYVNRRYVQVQFKYNFPIN